MGSWVSEDVYGGREEALASHGWRRSVVGAARTASLPAAATKNGGGPRKQRAATEHVRWWSRRRMASSASPAADLVTSTRHARASRNVYSRARQTPAVPQAPVITASAQETPPSLTHVYSRIGQLVPTAPTIVGTNIPMKATRRHAVQSLTAPPAWRKEPGARKPSSWATLPTTSTRQSCWTPFPPLVGSPGSYRVP